MPENKHLIAPTVADEIKRLTSDPGARKLGEYVDVVLSRLSVLEDKVASCCGGEDARPSARTEPPAKPATS